MAVDAKLLRGKTAEQQRVIKYFLDTGCLSFGRLKDADYDQLVMNKLNSLNLKQHALNKIGLDEDQLHEIPPVYLHGFNYKDAYVKIGADDRMRSSKYDSAWLFFSEDQVYMYTYTMDMTSESKKEVTEEYFYKDITSFSTSSETIEADRFSGCIKGVQKITREYSSFSLVVSGARFNCSVSGVADPDQLIGGMKQKLREKKQ